MTDVVLVQTVEREDGLIKGLEAWMMGRGLEEAVVDVRD